MNACGARAVTLHMYIDEIKLFAKIKKKELDKLIQIIKIHSQDVGMEFGIEKWAMFIMKSRKQIIEGIELQNQEKIRMRGEKEHYKYFEILEADTIKLTEMKEKVRKEYLR